MSVKIVNEIATEVTLTGVASLPSPAVKGKIIFLNDTTTPKTAPYIGKMTTDAIAHFKLNDNAANTVVVDTIDAANNGTSIQNTSVMSVAGKINTALQFTTDSDAISRDVANWRSGDSLGSISFWVKLNSLATYQDIFSSSIAAGTTFINFQVTYSDSRFRIATSAGRVRGSTTFTTGVWYHIVITSDGSTWKIYVNNVEETLTVEAGANTGDWFADIANRDNWTIGGFRYNGTYYKRLNGILDDFRYFNRVLTATERAELYNSGSGTEGGEQPYWAELATV